MYKPTPPRFEIGLYWAATVVIAAGFLAACLFEIAGPWVWGHNGFNGAAFVQAAKNSLRFGVIGQAQYHTLLTSPDPATLYTRHPMLLHAHLVLSSALLGANELAGRLVPAAYSFGCLLMVWALARRFLGRAESLLAAAIYATTPLNLICANMINHEQGGIFWCLVSVYAYLAWLEAPTKSSLVGLLVAMTMATQFDWPAYYVALLLAFHVAASGLTVARAARARGERAWAPHWTLLAVFSLVVLANFSGFFAWIVHTRGSLDNMLGSFKQRSSHPPGYWAQVWRRSQDLQGAHLIGLLVLALPWSLVRMYRGRSRPGELAMWIFALAQTFHSTVFKQAGFVHAYWTYYLNPALAFAGAVVLADLFRLLARARVRVPWLLPWAAGLILLVPQTTWALAKWHWGVSHGHTAYVANYKDHHDTIMLARWLGQRYKRGQARFVIERALYMRFEHSFYLDAPRRGVLVPGFTASERRGSERGVLVTDVCRSPHTDRLRKLVVGHGGEVVDGCYLIIRAGGRGGQLAFFKTQKQPTPWWWRWLVSARHPRERIVQVSPPHDPLYAVFGPELTPWARGGKGPRERDLRCERRTPVVGLEATVYKKSNGTFLSALDLHCAHGTSPRAFRGEVGEAEEVSASECLLGERPVGLTGTRGRLVSGLLLLCSPREGADGHSGAAGAADEKEGATFSLQCPKQTQLVGLRLRAGALVDDVRGLCEPIVAEPAEATAR